MTRPTIIGRPTIRFETIDSTNDYAINLVSNSNPNEGTVIWASYQTHGRGQIGSKWDAAPEENLLMSVILHPRFLLASQQFALNIIASLAVKASLLEWKIDAKVKWPNDVYVGDKKISGILIQNILQGKSIKNAVIGIGINANQIKFDHKITNPTSIKLENDQLVEIESLKITLCKHLQYYYKALDDLGYKVLKKEYEAALYMKDVIRDYTVGSRSITGVLKGISDFGRLQVEHSNHIHEYNFKEIIF